MAIDGLSQSSGVERLLEVARTDAGVLFVIRDRVGDVERERIVLRPEEVLAVLTERPAGRQTLTAADDGRALDIEVGRNEILLWTRDPAKGEGDVAVGLDDFQDALEPLLSA